MTPLSAAAMLDVWEHARRLTPPRKALALLAAACPESSWQELARLRVGERDVRLLTLREWAFGVNLRGIAACPECSETVEMTLRADEMGAMEADSDYGGHTPTSEDLIAIEGIADPEQARAALLARCIDTDSPCEDEYTVVARIAESDPRASIELALECAGCGHRWLELFDIVSFFWTEIEAWARRTLGEVHVLAAMYGWTEGEILALTPWRRQIYLEMATG